MEALRRYWAEINLDALRENALTLQQKSGKELFCVIKADAYGHGDYAVARELENCGIKHFAVSNLQEAMSLREKGIASDLLIFGTTPETSFSQLLADDLTQTVYSYEYARKLSDFSLKKNARLRVHIKLDTGMGRMGFRCCDGLFATEELKKVLALPGLLFERIYTHFSSADSRSETDIAYTLEQYRCFETQVQILQDAGYEFRWIHCQNSGGILLHEAPVCNACRPGLVLYGISPFEGGWTPVPLRQVMSLHATITDVKVLPVGAFVSYGRHFQAARETKTAIVPVGYADGYLRCLSGGEVILPAGKAKTIGNICMDQFMVDVTDLPVSPGDECILMGKKGNFEISAWELAKRAGTIPYEIICGVSRRVPRLYEKAGCDNKEISYL